MYANFLLVPAHRMTKAQRKHICVAAATRKVYLAVHGESILVPLKIGAARADAFARRITELNVVK